MSKPVCIKHIEETAFDQAIHVAARKGLIDYISDFIDQGHDINVGNMYNETCLHIATITKNVTLVKLLVLVRGIDMNAVTVFSYSPLNLATLFGFYEIASVLVHHGARVNSVDAVLHTPLHTVAWNFSGDASFAMAKLLIEKGANVNALDVNGETPLHKIALRGRWKSGENSEASINTAELLVKSGCDVNKQCYRYGNSALHLAISHSNEHGAGMTKKLLELGASTEVYNKKNILPIHVALEEGSIESVEDLLKFGSSIDRKQGNGKAPVETVMSEEKFELIVKHVVKLNLANIKTNVNIPDQLLERLQAFQEECLKELDKIKRTIVGGGARLSVVFILRNRPRYLKNEETFSSLVKIMDSTLLSDQFPLYGSVLKNEFVKTQNRFTFENKTVCLLKKSFQIILPDLVLDEIVKYINSKDVKHDKVK